MQGAEACLGAGGLPQAVSQLPMHMAEQAKTEGSKRSGSVSSGNSSKSSGNSSKSSGKRRRRNKKKEKIPPAAPNTFTECPCEHNNWDNVRVKKGHITLRCRICQEQWKTETNNVRKCLNFFQSGSCAKGSQCPNPHIHRYKQSLTKRKMIFGEDLLMPKQIDISDIGQPLPRSKDQVNQKDDSAALTLPSPAGPPPVPLPKKAPNTETEPRRLSSSGNSQGAPALLEGASSSICNSSPGETPLSAFATPLAGGGGSSFFTKQNKSTFGSVRSGKREEEEVSSPVTPTGSERRISIVTDTGEVESLEDEDRDREWDGMTDQEIDDMFERSSACGEERKKYQPTLRREAEERRAAHSRSGSMDNLDFSSSSLGMYHQPVHAAPVPTLSSPYGHLEQSALYTPNETSTFGQGGTGTGTASGFGTPTTSAPTTPSHSQVAYRTSPVHNYAPPPNATPHLQHPVRPVHVQPTQPVQYQPYAPVS